MAKVEIDDAIWSGIKHYIKTLHKAGAVDDVKMSFQSYYPLEHLMKLWGIEPYKIQHDPVTPTPGQSLTGHKELD